MSPAARVPCLDGSWRRLIRRDPDVYIPNDSGNEWYINQSNFYRQVRNFIIDIEDTVTASVAGLHWQVAQATSLTNVYVYADDTNSSTTAMGMYTENGSSGMLGSTHAGAFRWPPRSCP